MNLRHFVLVGLAVAVLGVAPAGAATPLDPLKKFMRDSGTAIRKAFKPPVTRSKTVAKKPATDTVPVPPPEPVATAGVPTPRVRPDETAAAATTESGGGASASKRAPDFDAAFGPDADAPEPAPVLRGGKGDRIAAENAVAGTAPGLEVAIKTTSGAPPTSTDAVKVPIPTPRPRLAALAPELDPSQARPKRASLTPGPTAGPGCAANLAALGIVAKPMPAISKGACGVAAPVAVASIENGAVSFSEKAIVNCAVAGAIATWMRDDVQPEAKKLFGGEVTSLRIAASYDCRGRNNDPSAQLSEHAFGNAIDISAFKIADHGWVAVGHTKGPAETLFLASIRKDACGPFTTVLGPGQPYHDEHFHLDLAHRGKSGHSLYCR